jgi:hypothetical protein
VDRAGGALVQNLCMAFEAFALRINGKKRKTDIAQIIITSKS